MMRKKSITKKYKITQGAKNDLVDLTEDSDDEVVEIIRQAVAPSNDSIHTYAQQDTLIASAQSQSDEIANDHHISAATNTNDENDIQTESNLSEDLDNKEVVESKTSAMDSSCTDDNQLHGNDRQEKNSSNDTYEGSSDNNIDNDASETSEVQSKPSSPASVYFASASATAATPVWDNRTSKRAYKKGNRRYNFTSSSDEDDFDIMRAKLAKRKQASDSSDSEDDFNMMRSKLKSK